MIAKHIIGKTYDEVTAMYDHFVVTGLLYNSTKRFVTKHKESFWSFGVNLWRGSVWGVSKEGKRTLLKRVYN